MRDNVNIRRDDMRYNVRGIPILVSSTDFVLPYFEGSLYSMGFGWMNPWQPGLSLPRPSLKFTQTHNTVPC